MVFNNLMKKLNYLLSSGLSYGSSTPLSQANEAALCSLSWKFSAWNAVVLHHTEWKNITPEESDSAVAGSLILSLSKHYKMF